MTRFGTSAMMASGTAADTMATPNSRRRLKSLRKRVPGSMPSAMPTKMAAKTRPQPAFPPCSVSTM